MTTPTFVTAALKTGASVLMLKYGTPVDPHRIKTEIGSSDANVAIKVELTQDHNDLIATGCIYPKFGYSNLPTWKNVEIQILNPRGKLVYKSNERWILAPQGSPRSCASVKRWPFQVRFHEMPATGSTVRVRSCSSVWW